MSVVVATAEELADLVRRLEKLEASDSAARDAWPAWMETKTAAAYLDVSVRQLERVAVERREIPYSQQDEGCKRYFARADLDAHRLRALVHGRRA